MLPPPPEWTYEFDDNLESKQRSSMQKILKQKKMNSTFPIKIRTNTVQLPKKNLGFVKDDTKAKYVSQETKKPYYSDVNTGYAFNQIDINRQNRRQKEEYQQF